MSLQNIKTIIILMYENRSFDHMLGHLSYENILPEADGLKQPLTNYENLYQGGSYLPFIMPTDRELDFDIPHEYTDIALQLARSTVNGKLSMSGFVEAYAAFIKVTPNIQCDPMGFFSSKQVPITSFLAQHLCACDRWFSPLPSSTQPNRTMAFCGESSIYKTALQTISAKNNIFDWLDKAGIDWRVYHDGLSFFALYPQLWKHVLGNRFKDNEFLFSDLKDGDAPQVIIVEPTYHDGPHIGSDHPNDNHAPLAIGWGEDFLRRTYEAAIANPNIWAETLMVVYYDEHGGFYDHVPPPSINTSIATDPPHAFDTLGARVPALLVSPWVEPGKVCHEVFDHTSVLQFLAEKFTPGTPYSPEVAARSRSGQAIASISKALSDVSTPSAPPPPAGPINVHSALGKTIVTAPHSDMGRSFEQAARAIMDQEPQATKAKYPELYQWKAAVDTARTAAQVT
jgi:phospholipase C